MILIIETAQSAAENSALFMLCYFGLSLFGGFVQAATRQPFRHPEAATAGTQTG